MTIRKTRFPNRIFYFCIRVRYAYNRLYIHFNRLLSFFNLSKYLNTICWSWDVEWISKEISNDIFSCSRFRPGIEKNSRNDSTRKLLNCVNFSFLRRISGSKKLETWKSERNQRKRERQISSLQPIELSKKSASFSMRRDCSRYSSCITILKLRYTSMECSTDGEHVTIASNIRNQFASFLMDE